jgi:hypothetical protein
MEADETLDWESFEQKVKELRGNYCNESSPLLFRGQRNFEWKLETTLERNGAERMLFTEYYELICAGMGPEVETFAGVDVPAYDHELCKQFLKPDLLFRIGDVFPMPVYRYMLTCGTSGFRRHCSIGRVPRLLRHSSHSETTSRRATTPRRDRFGFSAKDREQ